MGAWGITVRQSDDGLDLDTMPVIVRDMDDDTAIIYMVGSNLRRENILPSEKAQAYKRNRNN